MRGKQILVLLRVLQQLFQHLDHLVRTFRRDAVEAEAFRLLALAVKVGEKVIQRIAVAVEAQEILRVFRFGGFHVRCAVALQPRDHADLARLLVPDDQNVLFFLFLFHTLLLLIGLHLPDALRI